MKNCLFVFCGPSGSGKTTIVHHLLKTFPQLEFSVSATTRAPRKNEVNGKDYYFITSDEFKQKIKNDEFVECEEVYENNFYGTLKSEIERIWKNGNHVIFDIDVEGGLTIKKKFPNKTVGVFVKPPSIEHLRERLLQRSTESDHVLEYRVRKAVKELDYAGRFDFMIENHHLINSLSEAEAIVKKFLNEKA